MDLKRFLQSFGYFAILLTILPFIALDYWWIRIFDFPHAQLTVLTLVAFLIYFFRFDLYSWRDYVFAFILAGCFIFQMGKIYPFTPFAELDVLKNENSDPDNTIGILAANVLQKNEKTEELLDVIFTFDADLIILTETSQRWRNEVAPELKPYYPYSVEVPLENTYGMLLYSRYELLDPEVKYLVDDSIPSIHGKIKLPSGQLIEIHSIHPTPPMPQHNPKSTDRDAEMMIVAKMAKESELPVIVTGDFNDVAWSRTTSLFKSVGELLDPRVGRGFFNTYSANTWIMRWPLDHLFISEEFRTMELERGRNFGSDHFPLYSKLSLEPENAEEQKPEPASSEEMESAMEQIRKVTANPDQPLAITLCD